MSTPRGQWSCGGCDRRWQSLSQAHCTVCHEHFSTVGVADLHHTFGLNRAMTCHDPGSLRAKRGEGDPVYRLASDAYGAVWRSYDANDRFTRGESPPHVESAALTGSVEGDGKGSG